MKWLSWILKLLRSKQLKKLECDPYDNQGFGFTQKIEGGNRMRVLYINEDVKTEIARLIKHAKANKLNIDKIRRISEGLLPPIGDDHEFSCKIEHGYRIVFSIEQHNDKKWYRHMSVSVNERTKLPSIPAVELLMTEFEFVGKVTDCDNVWVEQNIAPMAVNVIQELKL